MRVSYTTRTPLAFGLAIRKIYWVWSRPLRAENWFAFKSHPGERIEGMLNRMVLKGHLTIERSES